MIFQKWGGGVKGHLELFRKFIRFGRGMLPLEWIMPSEMDDAAQAIGGLDSIETLTLHQKKKKLSWNCLFYIGRAKNPHECFENKDRLSEWGRFKQPAHDRRIRHLR